MSAEVISAFRTTLAGAKTLADGRALTEAEVARVVDYLRSDGSGPRPGVSFADLIDARLSSNPARLAEGQSYVVFGGIDRHGVANFDSARSFVRSSNGGYGVIGDTPWGKYIESSASDPDVRRSTAKLAKYLAREGIVTFNDSIPRAVSDIMWNAGSPQFARNAIESGRPVVGFVDNAPLGRGFTKHELSELLSSPETRFNGVSVKRLGSDPVKGSYASSEALRALENELSQSASFHSNRVVTVQELRSSIDLAYGWDAGRSTIFGMPHRNFVELSFEDMVSTADRWSRTKSHLAGDVTYRTPVERVQALASNSTHVQDISVRESGALQLTPEAAGDATFSSEALRTRRLPATHAANVIGGAAIAAEALSTASDSFSLHNAGNSFGAQSEVVHFAGRNMSGWAGAVVGAQSAAALGIETGPGVFVAGAVGGTIGAVAGEKLANKVDDYRTYNQEDRNGQSWHMDPAHAERGWTRTETRIDPNGPTVPGYGFSAPAYKTETITAPPEIANELNYKASGVQVQMALAHPSVPRNPYSIEAKPGDAPSLREANWQRDPNTHAWRREVTTGYMEHGLPMTRSDVASPERTRELERSSAMIAEENRANRPSSIAQRYIDAHREYGWNHFGPPEPAAVTAASAPKNVLQASDGDEYKRTPDGTWKHEGWFGRETQATGNLRDELNEASRSNSIHAPSMKPAQVQSPAQERINEMLEAARSGDWNSFRQNTQAFAEMPAGQQLQQQAVQQANHIEQHAEQQRTAQLQQQQNDQQQQQSQQASHGPRMVR